MKKYKRVMSLKALLKQNSHFLFGPRATGKSFLIKEDLPNCTVYNLLDDEVYSSLMRRPKIIEEAITSKNQIIVIDEIQKLPKLLDEVHRLIESKKARFLLTGSSVRKLKKEGHNLLAGRAWEAHLFPLTWKEIPNFNLIHYLNYGGLPRIYLSKNPKEELFHYVNSYLKEEIKEEAVVRSYEKFVYFLDAISLMNAKELHYQNLSSECGVPVRTLEGYIEVLIDTLIGFELLPYRKTKKRIAYARSKFYFFDIGVANSIAQKSSINENSSDFGDAFETFIINEVKTYLSYNKIRKEIMYWRTKICEVDLVIDKILALEIKSSKKIKDEYFKGLKYFKEECKVENAIVISRDKIEGVHDEIKYMHYETFLKNLWSGKYFNE